jgi:hypothetical protein
MSSGERRSSSAGCLAAKEVIIISRFERTAMSRKANGLPGGSTMTGEDRATGVPRRFTDEELAFIGAHFTELRSNATGSHYLYWGLAISFVVGLAAHIGGYLLGLGTPSPLLGLLAGLLYALGVSLWTGVVLVLFVQVVPEVKRRGIMRYLDDYEATLHDGTGAQPNPAAGDDTTPTVGGQPV